MFEEIAINAADSETYLRRKCTSSDNKCGEVPLTFPTIPPVKYALFYDVYLR